MKDGQSLNEWYAEMHEKYRYNMSMAYLLCGLGGFLVGMTECLSELGGMICIYIAGIHGQKAYVYQIFKAKKLPDDEIND